MNERDTIYVVNKYDELVTFTWGRKRLRFPYDVPVKVEYAQDVKMISALLQLPQIRIALHSEVTAYWDKVNAGLQKQKAAVESVEAQDSAVESLLNEKEKSNETK